PRLWPGRGGPARLASGAGRARVSGAVRPATDRGAGAHPPRAHRVGRARPASPLARPRPLGSRLSRAAAHAGAPARGAPAAGLGVEPLDVALLALLVDQPPMVARRCLQRLALGGARGAGLAAAPAAGRRLAARL